MGLVGAVVGILSNDDDFELLERRAFKGVENAVVGWVDGDAGFAFLGDVIQGLFKVRLFLFGV